MIESRSLRCSVCTEIGPVKAVNEDSFFAALDASGRRRGLFAVADGISGSVHGEIASACCTAELEQAWKQLNARAETTEQLAVQQVTEALLRANELAHQTRKNGGGSATTLSVLLLWEEKYHLLHVGDSRIYRYRLRPFSVQLRQLSEDHSCMVRRERDGYSYEKSVLTRSIGSLRDVEYQYAADTLRGGDRFLLCSDGLIKTVEEKKLRRSLRRIRTEAEGARMLVEEALEKGERDNVTAICVEVKRKRGESYGKSDPGGFR